MGENEYASERERSDNDGEHGLSVAELVCELIYADKPLSEIAGYDDRQMRWIISRKRDDVGKLIRRNPDLPPWVEVDAQGMRVVSNPKPFSTMFRQVKKRQGFNPQEAEEAWQEYKSRNPNLGVANRDQGNPYTHSAQTDDGSLPPFLRTKN